jgi:phytoene dehydrogenase-like protein
VSQAIRSNYRDEPLVRTKESMLEMNTYDTIVIGAGNAGLTASATLAQAGQNVLLLEQHNVPGGCATSFVRGRFEFEVALHQLSGIGTPDRPGLTRMALDKLGVSDTLEFVLEKDLYRVHIPGEIDITLPADRTGFEQVLSDAFPDEADNIHAFMELVYRCGMQYIVGQQLRRGVVSTEDAQDWWPEYFQLALKTAAEILDEYFTDEKLKHVISAYWGYMGSPPTLMKFLDLAVLLWVYIEFSPAHLKGGSQALSTAILRRFTDAGGEIRLNTRVVKILVENGRACGVTTADGQTYRAHNIVSNLSPIVTYAQLMEPDVAPEVVFKDMASRQVGVSGFVLYVGLDCDPSDIGINTSCTFLGTQIDHDASAGWMRTLDPPSYAVFTCYDVEDPEFSPPGATHVALMTLQYGSAWDDVTPEAYSETKYAYAEYLMAMAEDSYPGFRAHVEELEVATPLTFMHYLGHPGGAIYGFEQDIWDMDILHPDLRNAMPGLYLASSWAEAGGFEPTLRVGVSVAKRLLAETRVEVAS